MAKHIETGKKGEKIAYDHLVEQGYEILETNWRHRKLEVDLIAKEGEILVFVEVKTRSYDYYGKPEEFVGADKEKHLAKAAAAYMKKIKHHWAFRFDVVSVLLNKENSWTVKIIKDAFYPGLE